MYVVLCVLCILYISILNLCVCVLCLLVYYIDATELVKKKKKNIHFITNRVRSCLLERFMTFANSWKFSRVQLPITMHRPILPIGVTWNCLLCQLMLKFEIMFPFVRKSLQFEQLLPFHLVNWDCSSLEKSRLTYLRAHRHKNIALSGK